MTTATAALQGVEKHYKKFTLGPIDLVVPAGSIVGLWAKTEPARPPPSRS